MGQVGGYDIGMEAAYCLYDRDYDIVHSIVWRALLLTQVNCDGASCCKGLPSGAVVLR